MTDLRRCPIMTADIRSNIQRGANRPSARSWFFQPDIASALRERAVSAGRHVEPLPFTFGLLVAGWWRVWNSYSRGVDSMANQVMARIGITADHCGSLTISTIEVFVEPAQLLVRRSAIALLASRYKLELLAEEACLYNGL